MHCRERSNGTWLVALLAAAICATAVRGQAPSSIEQLLTRVEQRLQDFYKRAQSVVCIERSIVQPIGYNYSPEGFTRTVESELRIQADDAPGEGPKVIRLARKVNGRLPRESDKKERSGCTDPEPLSIDALAFLLPDNRETYQFALAGSAYDRGRFTLLIDFETTNRRSKAELIEDKGGHDDCFDWSGHVATQGRIWVDANTYDVLRVERHLRGPVDVNVPARIQRKHHLGTWVTLSREDVTTRYRTVTFEEPGEVFLVPESIESVLMVQGGLQSTRRSQTYSDYKRFTTAGRVVE
jgi:hypothetical protein